MDKGIIEVITDMLIKQDGTNRKLDETNRKLDETNNILKDFMEVSINQWKEQQRFNEKLYEKVTGLEKLLTIEERVKRLESLEQRIEERITKIEKTLKAS